jgi:hypothetical protein
MIRRTLVACLILILSATSRLPAHPSGGGNAGPYVCEHCPSTNGDEVVDVVDLVDVVLGWGPCGQPCDADVSGDGLVDVTDLVDVILGWGACVPPNDDCADVIDIALEQFADCFIYGADQPFCTIGATTDGPTHSGCGSFNQIVSDVWFRVTAVYTGPLVVTTCLNSAQDNADFNTKIAVYGQNINGICNCPGVPFLGAPLLACNDNDPLHGSFCSSVTIDAEAGLCYRIRVGGFIAGEGAGILALDNRPAGEFCTAPIVLPPNDPFVTVSGTTADNDAACDDSDDSTCAFNDTIDEWYLYQPFCDATVTVTTCAAGTNFDTTLAVYQGFDPPLVCPGDLPAAQVACNDDFNSPACQLPDGSPLKSRVTFVVTSGDQPFLIRVSGYNGATGAYQMTVETDCIGGQ